MKGDREEGAGEREGSSCCSSQHLFILTKLAQLHLHKATHRGNFLNAKDAFPVTRDVWSDGNAAARAIASPRKATVGGLSGRCVWPVSPWPLPKAEGQEVARDPGRIQALLCVSLSNNHQILNSNEKQAQAPLIESLLLHPYFTVLLSCSPRFR